MLLSMCRKSRQNIIFFLLKAKRAETKKQFLLPLLFLMFLRLLWAFTQTWLKNICIKNNKIYFVAKKFIYGQIKTSTKSKLF